MEAESFTPNIIIALFSIFTAFTILSYIPDDKEYKEFQKQSYQNQLDEYELEENEKLKQQQKEQQIEINNDIECNNNDNNEQTIPTSSIWNRLFGWLWLSKGDTTGNNAVKTIPSIESVTTSTTTTTITTSISSIASSIVELKAELDQETQNRNIERKGRLLAEQRLMDELALNQTLSKKNNEMEDYSKKLLSLCSFTVQKKKQSEQSLAQLTEYSNNILNSISQKISPNEINNEQITITIDKELLDQLELLSKSLNELQSSTNSSTTLLDSTKTDESIFLDLIKLNQKLPFTFADII